METLLYVLIVIVAFFVFREILMWYWKINETIEKLDKIESHLATIAENTKPTLSPPSNKSSETLPPRGAREQDNKE